MYEPLLRYDLACFVPATPPVVADPNGYWTPWHLAEGREAILRARVAELERDAARLDWMIRNLRMTDLLHLLPTWNCSDATARVAIDEAMEGE